VLSSGGRVRGVCSSGAGDGGDRSCGVLAEVGRSDERRGWALDLDSVADDMRVTVGVVELDGTGEGECSADGEDMRFTRAMRERSLSWREESTWRCLGATSSAIFRNRSSFCSPSVPDVSVAPRPLWAGRRASCLLGGLDSDSDSDSEDDEDDSSMELAICLVGRAVLGVR
jgi:hypothetical protein